MKKLIGVDVGSYSFSAATRTITISGVTISKSSLLLIVHVPTRKFIYNFAANSLGGTITLPGTIVLDFDTTAFSNTDPLQIWVDVDLPQEVSFVKDDSPDNLNVDVSDIYVRALLRKLMQLKYTSSSDLMVVPNGGSVTTVTTLTTMTTGNVGFGDAGKAQSYQQVSAITGNMSRRCFVWE